MSGRIRATDVEQQFDLLVSSSERAGADTDGWTLVPGDDDSTHDRRTPWVITTNGRPITLGFTRREVFAALAAMNLILSEIMA